MHIGANAVALSGALLLAATLMADSSWAAPNDWAEGVADLNDGATRDFYNRAARLPWSQQLGDWRDSQDALHGSSPYSTTNVADTDTPRTIEWDATALVQQWLDGSLQNEGFFLHVTSGGGPIVFSSREHGTPSQHPELEVVTGSGTHSVAAEADTYMESSTYQDMGNGDELRAGSDNNILVRFDLTSLSGESASSATLRLYTTAQYGSADIGLFRVSAGRDGPPPPLEPGYATAVDYDEGVAAHADTVMFDDFEDAGWESNWTTTSGQFDRVDSDSALQFEPLAANSSTALRVLMPAGENHALSLRFGFQDKTGSEPDEIYFRYHLRYADDWNQTVDGGKMPGIAGTYGVAGWGGRPSDGTNGWSARGSFSLTVPDGNPLAGATPVGNYVYHADMAGQYGDVFIWNENWGPEGYGGILHRNRWYCLEQYLRMNTPGQNDGVIRAWVDGRLSFEKTDFSFRTVDTLHIEEIWMNVYHGGTAVSPYDQHFFIDNVVIATSYVGPMGPLPDPPQDGGVGGSGTGGTGTGGNPPDGGAGDSGAPAGATPEEDSGCGCTVPGRAGLSGAAALLVLAWLWRRRHAER